jgi:hypothetical protein
MKKLKVKDKAEARARRAVPTTRPSRFSQPPQAKRTSPNTTAGTRIDGTEHTRVKLTGVAQQASEPSPTPTEAKTKRAAGDQGGRGITLARDSRERTRSRFLRTQSLYASMAGSSDDGGADSAQPRRAAPPPPTSRGSSVRKRGGDRQS